MLSKNLLIGAITILLFNPTLYSQTKVDQATREIDRSLRKELEKKLKVSPAKIPEIKKEEARKVEEEVKFYVKKIELKGCESVSPEEFKPLLEKYEDKELSLKELDELAKRIEEEYLKKGIIAACFVPPQEIKEGVVILQVVEAKMGKLEIKEHKYFDKNKLAYYWKIKPGEVLRYEKISQSLYLMNKNPDRRVKAVLHAGKKPQTTDILLDVNTRFPLHFTYNFNNEGVKYTGKQRKTFGARYNNFLGLDDILLGGYTFGKNFSGLYIYHRIPLTKSGTSIMYGYSYSKSFPKKEFEEYGIDGRTKNVSFFIYQDIFEGARYLGEIYTGLDIKDKCIKTYTGTSSKDRLRILRWGGNFTFKTPKTVIYVGPELSQGINLFGARRKSALSSRGAKNTFTKFNLEFGCRNILPFNLEGNLKLKSQISSTTLSPQEQFSLGGIDSVRGYPAGDCLADDALQVNLELLIPMFFIPSSLKLPLDKELLKEEITGLIFFDYGYGKKRRTFEGGKSTCNLKSLGVGLRIKLLQKAFLRLEWGFPLGDEPLTEKSKSRFHFSVDLEV